MSKGKTLNITLPDEMHGKLKLYADKKGLSVAALIRLACSEYMERTTLDGQNVLVPELLRKNKK